MSECIHRSKHSVPLAATLIFALALVGTVLVQSRPVQASHLPMCLGKQATIVGSNKANTLRGTKKADVIVGLGGNDRILGRGGADRICGGRGKDRLFGGGGNDQMNGGRGVDDCLQEAGTGTKKNCEGPKFPLTVSKAGTGTGTVTSLPPVIDCGQSCVGQFSEGQKVTLSASASSPSTFDGWAGICTGTGVCTLVLDKAKAVIASFSLAPSPGGPGGGGGGGGQPAPGVSCASPCFVVSKSGGTYRADSPSGISHAGSASFVVETAVANLNASGGGDIVFTAGIFDLGTNPAENRFSLHDISNIKFIGQGMDATVIKNFSTDSKDSEPFDMHGANRIVIRDLTVNAGGTLENTSDAIDFDGGNDVLIERVKVAESRGRGIVFDGKDAPDGVPRHANRNVVRDCVVIGIPRHGIELLASNSNRIEGCTITAVDGNGILINKAAGSAGQPHKDSDGNTLVGNVIEQVGFNFDGIAIVAGDSNVIDDNISMNNRDGIRIDSDSTNLFDCNDNIVRNNRSIDNRWYGVNIDSAACQRTVIEPSNVLTGNPRGACRDAGTNTIKPDYC